MIVKRNILKNINIDKYYTSKVGVYYDYYQR
jgi:hypothetical protein